MAAVVVDIRVAATQEAVATREVEVDMVEVCVKS